MSTSTSTVAPPSSQSTLSVEDLSVEVLTDKGWATVVDGVSFDVGRGETLGIVGESGSGKSVTCLAIAGLLPRGAARVGATRLSLLGRDVLAMSQRELSDVRGRELSMIFQEPMTSLNPAFTVGDQISEVLRRHRGASRRAAKDAAISLLDRVGVPTPRRRYEQYPYEFSGGMRQRVMIAMALACNPKVIIADEPTTALDVTVQAQILELLRELQAEDGMSVIFITHDLGVVADVCDRVLVMYAGQVVEQADVDDLFERPQHPYMEGLLRSMPRMDQAAATLTSIPGHPPRVGAFPQGCRFSPRCAYRVDACTEDVPGLRAVPGQHPARCIRTDELVLEGST